MPKTTAPAFPLLGGDWLKGTATLTASERGYYLDLLLYTWDSDKPIPADVRLQMQIARCTSRPEWLRVWTRLAGKWTAVEGGYRNERCERVRLSLSGYRRRKSDAGKLGAEKRWQRDGRPNGSAVAERMAQDVANGWPSISLSSDSDHKERDQSPAPTRQLLALFDELHQARFDSKAEINGAKDGAILAGLCRKRGAEETERLIREFFELRDPWVLERGFSVGVFKTQIPKLLARKPKRQAADDSDWFDECQRLHGRRCNGRVGHANQMAIDASKQAGT